MVDALRVSRQWRIQMQILQVELPKEGGVYLMKDELFSIDQVC